MISLRRVSVHNLKSVDLDLPYRKLIVFCGRSGSGKSSLVMDTLYAEGQRRYIETFSPAVRLFLETMEKPDAERLDGIPPAVAVSAIPFRKSSQMTVGQSTEIFDYLALLFSKVGRIFCPKCSREIKVDSPQSILEEIMQNPFLKFQIAFEPFLEPEQDEFIATWKPQGFLRGMTGNTPFRFDEGKIPDEFYRPGLLLVVDRLTLDNTDEQRILESLETSLEYGNGRCVVLVQKENETERFIFSRRLSCEFCDVHFPPLTPKLFETPLGESVQVYSKNIGELCDLTVTELLEWFHAETQRRKEETVIANQFVTRLEFLQQVGLGYLTLSRSVETLSGGEQRRIGLTSVLGSSLVDMLYVLDEPSIGLHPRDTEKLLAAIQQLRDRGNTVILVEHDEQLLRAADEVVEIGPGAGDAGGSIVFQGTVKEMLDDPKNLTGSYLNGTKAPVVSQHRKPVQWVQLTGCRGNNLKNVSVSFPLGVLCVVTGVSGAGKTTLVQKTLYPALCQHFGKTSDCLPFDKLIPSSVIDDVVLVDQTPMGRSSSSNPVTYLKIFDEIRNVFASTLDAKAKNITARHFSFNVDAGRCDHCKGDGVIVIDMQFLPDRIVPCPQCHGKRYRPEVLDILYRGKNIAEILNMTAREAFSFFRGQRNVQQKLKRLFDVGLDYLRIGQPTNTLSGGEAQRLKLATHLSQIKGGRSLILMDEPTAGLHFADVEQLIECFQALIETGHSLVVIEHNDQVIQAADCRIELEDGEIVNYSA